MPQHRFADKERIRKKKIQSEEGSSWKATPSSTYNIYVYPDLGDGGERVTPPLCPEVVQAVVDRDGGAGPPDARAAVHQHRAFGVLCVGLVHDRLRLGQHREAVVGEDREAGGAGHPVVGPRVVPEDEKWAVKTSNQHGIGQF